MIISCKKAIKICDKAQYKEASKWDLLGLRIHKFICRTCIHSIQKNDKLTSLCQKAKLSSLSYQEKRAMKERLTKEH